MLFVHLFKLINLNEMDDVKMLVFLKKIKNNEYN